MYRAVFAALSKGGHYAVIDHSARYGAGVAEAQTLHRIDEAVVRRPAGDRRGRSDRFAPMFGKP
jgi:predicted methyltransferase